MNYLKENTDVKLTSVLRYACERNEEGDLTKFRNGDRYIYAIWPIIPVLPSTANIAGRHCRIFHETQRDICKSCGVNGHKAGSDECEAFAGELKITSFRSYNNVLSNHFQCDIETEPGVIFKSTEHAYLYEKAVNCGYPTLADKIKSAKHAGIAKALSKTISYDDSKQWESDNVAYMENLIRLKAKQCDEFQQVLVHSEGIIAEATQDTFWGSGMTPEITECTDPGFWKGRNILGKIMMSLRDEILKDNPPEQIKDDNLDIPQKDENIIADDQMDEHSSANDSFDTVTDDLSTVQTNNLNETFLKSTSPPKPKVKPKKAKPRAKSASRATTQSVTTPLRDFINMKERKREASQTPEDSSHKYKTQRGECSDSPIT